ncbi:MAG: hypothetical protein FWC11_02735 [Firmicutes bacterium]|nr:hypothetical protein [Bacillota bacterium]MCL2255755.1 hypothetical protein [Bacillota bacterium]
MTINELAAILARNNSDEQSAIEGYCKILNIPNLPQELYDDIREIMSDEMNHSMKLSAWVTHLTGVVPNKT